MTFLKQACAEVETAKFPRRADRLELDRIVRDMNAAGTGGSKDKEPWPAFIERLDLASLSAVNSKDLRRLLLDLWSHETLNNQAVPIVDEGVQRDRKSIDLRIIAAFLKEFPTEHPAFDHLTQQSKAVAIRNDWVWKARSEKWQLFDPKVGPMRLSKALISADEPFAVLQEAGLDGDLASGGYVEDVLIEACLETATGSPERAAEQGRRLSDLLEPLHGMGILNAPLAYALLAPWQNAVPSSAYQKHVTSLLVSKIGDPRLAKSKWSPLESEVLEYFPGVDVGGAFAVLKRWLVQATFREFFAVVAKTVERPDQWRDRTEFWMAYLDAGHIIDAWFAFGSSAERMAKQLMEDKSVQYGKLLGSSATSQQSSLVFSLGDLRIAEWSDNGSCRFWTTADKRAPKLYESRYESGNLRTMVGGDGFKAIPHTPSHGWQPKFAHHIYRMTGILHPVHRKGWP